MSGRSMTIIGAAALALLGGIAVATRSLAPEDRVPPPATAAESAPGAWKPEIARLRNALDLERREREALQAEIARLRDRVRDVEVDTERAADASERRLARLARQAAHAKDDPARSQEDERAARKPGRIDTDAIVAAGFERAQVQEFRSRMDGIELERLYLRDVAAREGWLDTPRFRKENRELADAVAEVRGAFSEDLYDWMLYASGQPNRMEVAQVMAGSAAAEAGLEAGDVIVRYGDERIFGFHELRDATQAGVAGEATRVTVSRDGRQISVTVPRGPLGVQLEPRSLEPPPAS